MGSLILTLVGTTCLLLGLAIGVSLCYIYVVSPQITETFKLVEIITSMKKQGFVRQYEVEQAVRPDPSSGIREY